MTEIKEKPKVVTPKNSRLTSADYLEELKNFGYDFKMDLRDDSIYVADERLNDALAAEIRVRMRDKKAVYTKRIRHFEDAYIAEARANSFHPVKDYLSTLEWDGGDYITQLCTYFQDKHDMFHIYLRRWLIGAVAKAHTGYQNMMLVLEGKTDIGKSFFTKWICPVPGLYVEATINPDTKDCLLLLITKWVWEVGELGATTRRADREALKSFITKEIVTVRKPWGRHAVDKPALSSFIGTFNDEGGVLSDPTGNRRFNICSLEAIDWNYATDIDVDLVWAEAQQAYFDGEPWRLTRDEAKRQIEINLEYEIQDPVEDLIREHYDFTNNPDDFTAVTDILATLQVNGIRESSIGLSRRIAAIMKKNNIEKGKDKTRTSRGYRGVVAKSFILQDG